MMRTGDWSAARTMHWVSSYVVHHEAVYGFAPEEARLKKWRVMVAGMAKRVLRDSFGGDANAMAEFVWWVWERERRLELYWEIRRRDGTAPASRPPRRLEVAQMFCARMVDRYRFAIMRERPTDDG